jgi:hypothetical protein
MTIRARGATAAAAAFALCGAAAGQTWENCTPLKTILGKQVGSQFGWIGVRAGDVDGDLTEDYLITAPFFASGAGRVLVYSGVSGDKIFGVNGQPFDNAGFSGGAAGELDGDSFAEFGAGAPNNAAGAGYVWSGVDGSLHFSAVGEAPGDRFGNSFANVGDLDGDLIDDIAFGAPLNDAAGVNAGRVYVHSGASGLRIRTFDGLSAGNQFGDSLAGVGDRDGDTVPDIMVGAAGGVGRAYVVSGVDGSVIWTFDGDATSVNFSQFFVGGCGDVNADGTEDLFASDFNNSALGVSTGRVFVYDGTNAALLYTITGEGPNDGFGIGRAVAGDLDGDGHGDLVFGHWTNNAGANGGGRVSIFSGCDGSKLFHWTGTVAGTNLGYDAAGIADLDGDGFMDFLLTGGAQNGNTGVAHVVSSKNPEPPTNYCVRTPNSVGPGTRMSYSRSTGLTANKLRLHAREAPPNNPGLFFYGLGTSNTPFGAGTLCVSAPRYRLGPPATVGPNGVATYVLDFNQGPFVRAGAVAAGTTAYFQFAHRDATGPAGNLPALSDGIRITFCP